MAKNTKVNQGAMCCILAVYPWYVYVCNVFSGDSYRILGNFLEYSWIFFGLQGYTRMLYGYYMDVTWGLQTIEYP